MIWSVLGAGSTFWLGSSGVSGSLVLQAEKDAIQDKTQKLMKSELINECLLMGTVFDRGFRPLFDYFALNSAVFSTKYVKTVIRISVHCKMAFSIAIVPSVVNPVFGVV